MLKRVKGFSLLELSIVLVLLSILFTGILIPFNERQNQQLEEKNERLLLQIKQSFLGFFIAHKHLPCPASAHSRGASKFAPSGPSQCFSQHGFVPFNALGLQGVVSHDGLFLDAWKRPIRYTISNKDHNRNNHWDWVSSADIRQTSTLSDLTGNLKICDKIDCSNMVYTKRAVVIIHSQGKLDKQSVLEKENSGEQTITMGNKTLTVGNDNTFVYLAQKNLTPQHYFDDQLLWISPIELYYYLTDK